MKILYFFIILFAISNGYALDLQSEPLNTDKSLFQSISDYQTIDSGRVFISNSLSLASKPIIDKNKNIIDLWRNEFSMVSGLNIKNLELGLTINYDRLTTNPKGNIQEFSGLTGIGSELKWNFYNSMAMSFLFNKTMSDSIIAGRLNNTIGFKLIAAFLDETRTPVFLQYVKTQSANLRFQSLDQSDRNQLSLGGLYRISKQMRLGIEFLYDAYKNNYSKEIMLHGTMQFDSFGLRAGFGSGFLNKNKQNESKIFINFMTDFDFRKEKIEKVLLDR